MSEVNRLDVDAVSAAVRSAWREDTAAEPARWTPDRPARTQCDATSFVAWELLGGDLVLGEVLVDGEHDQYHYWNRIDGVDLDLTASQFDGHEIVEERRVVPAAELREREPTMRDELKRRIGLLRARVHAELSGDADHGRSGRLTT